MLPELSASRASSWARDSARPWVICTSRAAQLAHQLHVVVARHAERRAGLDHVHHEPQHPGDLRPAVHEVAEEDALRPSGCPKPAAVRGRRLDAT